MVKIRSHLRRGGFPKCPKIRLFDVVSSHGMA